MLFNSIPFIIFFPIVVVLYYLIPVRFRYIWLLFCSYFFYMCQDGAFLTMLIISTITTYLAGIGIEKASDKRTGRIIIAVTVAVNIGILAVFKFADPVLTLAHSDTRLNLTVPLGISFYTLQAISYIVDCYRGEVKAERNFLKYALFVSFFLTILSGPIQRGKFFLKELDLKAKLDLDNVKKGLIMMLWGFFLKIVISARLTIWIDTVYADPYAYGGSVLCVTALVYVFLVYSDFEGYSNIAIGAAKILGIEMAANFGRPLLARNFSEFWKRWHIALSSWLRDYIYIPLGGSRKGKLRAYLNLIIVFTVSGLWHGANLTFLIWGLLNGLYQVIGRILMPIRSKVYDFCRLARCPRLHYLLQISCVVLLYAFSFIFFAAENVSAAWEVCKRIVNDFAPQALINGQIFTVGLGKGNLLFAMVALMILIASDIVCERRNVNVTGLMEHVPTIVRWGIYLTLVSMIVLSANLSMSEFIYAGM